MTARHPSTTHLLRYFAYDHLPANLAWFSAPFHGLAHEMAQHLPDGPELTAGLRKLLEAKDCMVRAALDLPPTVDPLAVLDQVETAPRYTLVPGCEHCPDGHTPPDHGQPWHAHVGPERDSDGQPTHLVVARAAGAHVAESDAEWVRDRLNGDSDA